MNAGELAQRVSVQTRTEVSDGHDGFTEAWSTLYSRIPGRVKPLAGRDLERARQVDPRVSHEVTVRYWRAYRTDCRGGRVRLMYHTTSNSVDDRTFEIVTPPVDVDERHEVLQMFCREAV